MVRIHSRLQVILNMSNFTKGIILIILGICIGLLSTVVPEAIGVFIPLAVFLGTLGIFKLIDD